MMRAYGAAPSCGEDFPAFIINTIGGACSAKKYFLQDGDYVTEKFRRMGYPKFVCAGRGASWKIRLSETLLKIYAFFAAYGSLGLSADIFTTAFGMRGTGMHPDAKFLSFRNIRRNFRFIGRHHHATEMERGGLTYA